MVMALSAGEAAGGMTAWCRYAPMALDEGKLGLGLGLQERVAFVLVRECRGCVDTCVLWQVRDISVPCVVTHTPFTI